MTFDPNEARDPHGRWTRGGGDSGLMLEHKIDPRVVDVSGDEWNRKTAERLEKEYAAARPEIDQIAVEGVSSGVHVDENGKEEDDEEDSSAPETWGDLSGSQQEEAEQHYKESHIDQEKEWAVNNWQDNGDPIYEAKHQLAEDDDFKSEWLTEFLTDREKEGGPRIPFNVGDLLGAINIKPGDSYDDDPEITFDEKYLGKPDSLDTETPTFPGIEPQNPADFLTKVAREEIESSLIEAFNEEAKSKAENIDPPDYLNEEAETNVQDAWNNMDDDEMYNYAKEHVDSLQEAQQQQAVRTPTMALAWPDKFDPLNLTSGRDYMRTQALAKYIADKRGAQLITERAEAGKIGVAGHGGPNSPGVDKTAWTGRMLKELQQADYKLWSGWKGSSTNAEGRLLQVASADELGGRIRDAKQPKWMDPANDPEEVKIAKEVVGNPNSSADDTANHKMVIAAYKDGAPPEVLKALSSVAKGEPKSPETDKMIMDYFSSSKGARERDKAPELNAEKVNGFIRLPDVKIEKNGAASTTVSPTVANGWNGTTNNAPQGINKKESIEYANSAYAAIGGYEGVKAAIRAKWETTQYLLDKADIPVVQAYRGISMDHKLKGDAGVNKGEFNAPASGFVDLKDGGKAELKVFGVGEKLDIASGKTITKVSSGFSSDVVPKGPGTWTYDEPKSTQSRIVLRAEVPRTAVVSVPAYGVNVKSEQEVVVAGAAWKGWDAWSGRAPTFEEVPMHTKADNRPASEIYQEALAEKKAKMQAGEVA